MWRWNPELHDEQQGTAIIPAHETLAAWISELENTTYEAVVKNGDKKPDAPADQGSQLTLNVLEELTTSASIEGGVVRSSNFGASSLERAKELHRRINGLIPVGNIAVLLETLQEAEAEKTVPAMIEEDERKTHILRIGQLIGAIKREMLKSPPDDWDGQNPFQYINGKLNRAIGVAKFSEKLATTKELAARKQAAKEMLGRVRSL
jgi:hypothetical protein